MKTYNVRCIERYMRNFEVEAESLEDAKDKLENGEYDDEYSAVEMEFLETESNEVLGEVKQ